MHELTVEFKRIYIHINHKFAVVFKRMPSFSIQVYAYIHICICVYTYVAVKMYIYVYICMYIFMCIYTPVECETVSYRLILTVGLTNK